MTRDVPQANDDFGDMWTPTMIDVASPFAQERNLALPPGPPRPLATPHEPSPALAYESPAAMDAPTNLLPRSPFQELPPGTIVGEIYEIDERLGAGSMGEVYAACHIELAKRVAIKVISTSLLRDDRAIGRFLTEARILAQFQHPAIVTVEHVGRLPDGRVYFVMELLRGESLSERLSRGRLSLREALRILSQMTRGLAAAHSLGVVHRDLKPDNTFLVHHAGEKPAVKLLDFGLAKSTLPIKKTLHHGSSEEDSDEDWDEPSDPGLVFGTPLYMSPEQARGLHLDHRSDIYSLGCIAYELILGTMPFPQAETTPAICAAHLQEIPPVPRSIWPEIPTELDHALFAMLAKDPAHRPTLTQIRSIIERLRSTPSQQVTNTPPQPVPTPGPPPVAKTMMVPRPPKQKALRRAVTITAAISILTIGVMLGIAVSSRILTRNSNAPSQIENPAAVPASR